MIYCQARMDQIIEFWCSNCMRNWFSADEPEWERCHKQDSGIPAADLVTKLNEWMNDHRNCTTRSNHPYGG